MRDAAIRAKRGFTLVELSLSIVFIAILSVTMALMINEAISTYRRGITLNQLNSVGMDLVDDMRTAVQNSSSRSPKDECETLYSNYAAAKALCTDGDSETHANAGGYGFVSVTKRAEVKVGGKSIGEVPVFGAFCTGTYSYIWNSGYFFNVNDYEVVGMSKGATLTYRLDGKDTPDKLENFKLAKVEDRIKRVCMTATRPNENTYRVNYNDSSFNGFDIASYETLGEAPVEVLSRETTNNLAVYGLDVAYPATSNAANDTFYAVSMILGTVQGGINVNASGNFCVAPEGYSALENFDYCAINKFNFAAQAIGG